MAASHGVHPRRISGESAGNLHGLQHLRIQAIEQSPKSARRRARRCTDVALRTSAGFEEVASNNSAYTSDEAAVQGFTRLILERPAQGADIQVAVTGSNSQSSRIRYVRCQDNDDVVRHVNSSVDTTL